MLDADLFAELYEEVYEVAPFPWQQDLVTTVLAERQWPDLIDVPTGMGKTAMIDIAVFLAAATGGEQVTDRPGRRRVLFVVDRRIVVDEAHARALRLAEALDVALRSAETTATRRVARALAALAPDADAPLTMPAAQPVAIAPRPVLAVTRMRGGITWDAAWIDRPDRPAVVIGTVDQVGSRMLFRGYGVSDRRKPIDAALVGTDSLVLVDEAHLAQALVTTLGVARGVDGAHTAPDALGAIPGASLVQLTATPASPSARSYSFDVDAHRDHRVAWRRLNAPKRLALRSSDARGVVDAMAGAAIDAVAEGARAVLVVCNTIARARQVHGALRKVAIRGTQPLGADVMLLIGRSRPADRDVLTAELQSRFGPAPPGSDRLATVLVATQTVEVGANLDADALVSESAPWDALVQRLGRLNRFGDHPTACRAIVVHDGTDDPVYGEPRLQTWAYLSSLVEENSDGLDVSPLACRHLSSTLPPQVLAERPTAPILLAPTLDAWVRTGPVPVPDPPIAPYLHGLGRQPATVAVAWRDGLLDVDPTGEDAERPDAAVHADLVALPVLPIELVEVPIHAARSWMRGDPPPPISDLDGVEVGANPKGRRLRDPFRVVVWRSDLAGVSSGGSGGVSSGGGSWRWVEADQVRPGDVLVAPTQRGGLDDYGWAPESLQAVIDVADVARFASVSMAERRGRLRLDGGTGARLGLDGDECRELRRRIRSLSRLGDDDIRDTDEQPIGDRLAEAVKRLLVRHADQPVDRRLPGAGWTPAALSILRGWLSAGVEVVEVADPSTGMDASDAAPWGGGSDRFLITARRGAGAIERDDELVECSSMAHRAVSLREHHANVADRAASIARALGLPEPVVAAVQAAAGWHDLGKVEPRFQAMLCGGAAFEALLLDEPLAKSGLDGNDRAGYRRARRRSGLPAGARHEAWSSALVQEHLAATAPAAGLDGDLVVHLVASHHGHARPWLPPIVDDNPRDVTITIEGGPTGIPAAKVTVSSRRTVDLGHPARFAALNQRYGRWGLALLEAIVRCADMTVSEEGS